MNGIGLRKEEKAFEGRVPVVPEHVRRLVESHGIRFVVEPSQQRAFNPDEYEAAGAKVGSLDTPDVNIVFGVKEMPIEFFQAGKVYVFFSHTIKGQKSNMPMLQKIIDVGATLIDYERVVDEKGRRLIFFGNWAGMAGISDTFRVLGQRLELEGLEPNPFSSMRSTLECKNLDTLKDEFRALRSRIEKEGLPDSLAPFIVGFAGYGNVSQGAQEMFDLLPHKTVEPHDLENLQPEKKHLYKVVFKEEHMVESLDSTIDFDLQDYYQHGTSKYRGIFHKYVPYLTVLMNCIYWTKKYPRLITKDFLRTHWSNPNRRLKTIGDISCDVSGAIEFTVRCTDAGNPAFTYIVEEDKGITGVEGNGPVIMAVDNLPCELPRESSTSFSETLLDFLPPITNADFTVPFEKLELPKELLDAIIVYNGVLTKNFDYLRKHLTEGLKK